MMHETFQTSDLTLAAYLLIQGYAVADITHEDGKGCFHFRDQPQRQETVLEFYNRQTTVEPIAFQDHIKSLKAMIRK